MRRKQQRRGLCCFRTSWQELGRKVPFWWRWLILLRRLWWHQHGWRGGSAGRRIIRAHRHRIESGSRRRGPGRVTWAWARAVARAVAWTVAAIRAVAAAARAVAAAARAVAAATIRATTAAVASAAVAAIAAVTAVEAVAAITAVAVGAAVVTSRERPPFSRTTAVRRRTAATVAAAGAAVAVAVHRLDGARFGML
eukprot:6676674-Prymnesium_polylepis.1